MTPAFFRPALASAPAASRAPAPAHAIGRESACPPGGASPAPRHPRARRGGAWLALASGALACALAGASAFAESTAARADTAPTRTAPAKAPSGAPASEKRSLADELFTEAEREAWRQKIDAAPDEAQKRQLRGQRLAELQRRSREAKAAAGAGKPASGTPREAR